MCQIWRISNTEKSDFMHSCCKLAYSTVIVDAYDNSALSAFEFSTIYKFMF